jgi:hypothetical protein
LDVQDAQASSADMVRVYVDTTQVVSGTGQSKVLASLLAKAWFAENDPEGTAFEYSLVDRIKD